MRFKALSLGLAAVLAVGCTDQATTPTALDDVAVAPSFNFMNGPENPGNSSVFRFEDYGFLTVTDPDQGLRIRLYDTFNTFRCGGEADDPFWDYQDVGGDRVKSVNQVQDVPIVVYPWPNNPDKSFCDFLAEDWLYRGMGVARVNDNNVFWFMGTGGNNSYSVRVNGTVEDPAGDTYQITGKNKYVVKGLCCFFGYDPDTGDPFFVAPEDVDFTEINTVETIKIH